MRTVERPTSIFRTVHQGSQPRALTQVGQRWVRASRRGARRGWKAAEPLWAMHREVRSGHLLLAFSLWRVELVSRQAKWGE